MKKLFYFCGMFCFLYFGAMLFEIVTRSYFPFGGKMVDFSLLAWGGICLLWGTALWELYKGRWKFFEFMCFFSLTCTAFVLCQYYLFTGNEEYGKQLRFLLAAETVAAVLFIFLRRGFSVFLSVSALGLALGSPYLITAKFFPLSYIFAAVGSVTALWLIFLIAGNEKVKRLLSLVGLVLFTGAVISAGLVIYLRVPGIRFYEAKVTEPAKEVKVSIVIPVYNAEEVIERCLDSLRRQTLKEIEIIAVDDGSTDKTPEILAEYAAHDARIRVIRQENAYVGAARNNGLAHAKGEYVGFVDSDDWVSADYYEQLYQTAVNSGKDVVITPEIWVVRQLSPIYGAEVIQKEKFSLENLPKPLRKRLVRMLGFVWNKLYKRDFLTANNILFSTRRSAYEDAYYFSALLLYLENIAVSDKGTYYYSRGERVTVSMVAKHASPNDEAIALFVDLEQMIKNAPVSDDIKEDVWLGAKKVRHNKLQNFYKLLKEEEREAFVLRCIKQFGEENCHFNKDKWLDEIL